MKLFSFLACGRRISQVLGVSENLLLVKPSHNHHILVCGCWVAKMICTRVNVHKSQLFSFFNFSVGINKLLIWINSIVYLAGRKWAFSDTQKKSYCVFFWNFQHTCFGHCKTLWSIDHHLTAQCKRTQLFVPGNPHLLRRASQKAQTCHDVHTHPDCCQVHWIWLHL